MFEYFRGNRAWSSAVNLAMMAGGLIGEFDHWLAPLRERTADDALLESAWVDAALHQEALAERDRENGFNICSSRRLLRAAAYYAISERHTVPGPDKAERYSASLQAFSRARQHGSPALERIDVAVPGGRVPGFLSRAAYDGPSRDRPIVMCIGGPDFTKELVYCIVSDALVRLGLDVLVVDLPGCGEALRLGGLSARPDTEVAVRAVVDHLDGRLDLRSRPIGVLGFGLGAYHAFRAAALEPRLVACAAWSSITDMRASYLRQLESPELGARNLRALLPWAMGTPDIDTALNRCRDWVLDDLVGSLFQPMLVLHGTSDVTAPIDELVELMDAVRSPDKTVWLFEHENGGDEPYQADQAAAPLDMIAEWFAQRLQSGRYSALV